MCKFHIYWWTLNRKDGRDNFGDILTEYLVKKISKKKIVKVPHPSMKKYKFFWKHYLVIGSILELANKKSIVWGSGIIRKNENVRKAKFLAVRGPRTKRRLEELGYKVPDVFGDPALLLPEYYLNNLEKKYKIGVIPHIIHYDEIFSVLKNDNRIKVVDLLTNNIEKTIDEILECEIIVSSSLHGVIVSQAYNIPSIWVKFERELAGDNIKFYDYFESVGINYKEEFKLELKNINYDYLNNLISLNSNLLLPTSEILQKRQKELLDSCPFNKSFLKRLFI